MLTQIHLQDFAIVDSLELELFPGMTALTGETGAGKSILVDALGLVLGDRAESTWVRQGADRAEISASFDVSDLPAARAWLAEQDLDLQDGECQLRRVIHREGRSRAYINGSAVPLQSLRALGDQLVDIHGQHEHQSLTRRDVQRQLLDDYGDYPERLEEVTRSFRTWQRLDRELNGLRSAEQDRDSRLEFLRFQVQELEALEPQPEEVEALEEEHRRLANTDRLLESCQRGLQQLYEADEASAHGLIHRSLAELQELTRLDPGLEAVAALLTEAEIQVQEAADQLRRYGDHLEQDPGRLQQVEDRLGALHQLARKHRVAPEALRPLLERLRAERDTLEHADQRLAELERNLSAAAQAYRKAATVLYQARQTAARRLARQVSEAMQELGMAGGRLEVRIQRHEPERFSPHGGDHIEYQVSANPGQPLLPLGKVASGGELSRISLAIQVIAAEKARIPTLIFDEVDTGVGGAVAETVGRQLRGLGQHHQVLCVTHLPQVGAQAHHHLQVAKLSGADATRTRIRALGEPERIEEIARMLGGIEITDSTRRHAEEMLDRALGPTKKTRRKKKSG